MPHGFDTPSGASLPDRLMPAAERLLAFLMREREAGRVTPDHPITGKEICERASKSEVRLSGPEVRAIVNYLRLRGNPIASAQQGYFFAKNASELEETVHHLLDRENAIRRARMGVESSFAQRSLFGKQKV